MNERSAQILGLRIPYLEREGEGPPILLVHGFATGKFVWKEFLRRWPGPHRILAPDLPGNGLSDLPQEEISIPYYVRFLDAFRAELQIDRFHAIGHSMGSLILAEYSMEHAHLRSLVLESPPDPTAPLPLSWKLLSLPIAGNLTMRFYPPARKMLRSRLQRSVHHPESMTEEYVDDSWTAFREGHLRKWIPRALRMKSAIVPWESVMPSLVVYGDRDSATKAGFFETLKNRMRKCGFHEFKNCGHIPHLEYPEEFIATTQNFLLRR